MNIFEEMQFPRIIKEPNVIIYCRTETSVISKRLFGILGENMGLQRPHDS